VLVAVLVAAVLTSCFIQKKPESSLSTFTFSKSPQTADSSFLGTQSVAGGV